ncbi:hypothetical protein D9M70_431750 [compost metagenome]
MQVHRRAELVEQRLGDLGHLHFQHHLLWRVHRQHVEYVAFLVGIAVRRVGVSLGNVHGLLRGLGIGDAAGQHQVVGSGHDPDAGLAGQQLHEGSLQAAGIRIDHHVDDAAGAAAALHDHVGGADGAAQHIEGLRRHHGGLDDGGIAQGTVADGLLQADQLRLADWHDHAGFIADGAGAIGPACLGGGCRSRVLCHRGRSAGRHADRHLHRAGWHPGGSGRGALGQVACLHGDLRGRRKGRTENGGQHQDAGTACGFGSVVVHFGSSPRSGDAFQDSLGAVQEWLRSIRHRPACRPAHRCSCRNVPAARPPYGSSRRCASRSASLP